MNRALSVLVCLALIALIPVLQYFVVSDEDAVGPITTSGEANEEVSTDDFTLEVAEVDLTSSLSVPSGFDEGGETVEANGAWVVVWARLTAAHTTIDTFPAELQMADGTTYFERGWFTDTLDRESLSPGLPLQGAFVFEVPVEQIHEPALVVTHAEGYDGRLGAQASIDLDLSAAEPSDEPVALLPPEIQTGEATHAPE